MDFDLVVVGGGQAGAQVIDVARAKGFAGSVLLVGEEPLLPYQRPPLSKQYLSGRYPQEWLLYRPPTFYEKHKVTTRLGVRVAHLDRHARCLGLSDGSSVHYGQLALTTGARAVALAVPGSDLPGIHCVRTAADSARLGDQLRTARRVVVIGSGFIGLEVAAALVQTGREVTLLARQERLLSRTCPPVISEFLVRTHRERGVRIEVRKQTAEIRLNGEQALRICCTDGTEYEADAIVVGIGALPNVELAAAAGLDCRDGILVDEHARTSDDAVFAAGDCTRHPNALLGASVRLETVHNAVEQGRAAGLAIAGCPVPYTQIPWVWTDQFQLRLQSLGVASEPSECVVRGAVDSGAFSVFQYRDGELAGLHAVNQPRVFAAVRRIMNAGVSLDPRSAGDKAFDLASLAPKNSSLVFDRPWTVRRNGRPVEEAWGHS